MMKEELTQSELKEKLSYCAESGEFTWLQKRRGVSIGKVAGNRRTADTYIQIMINGYNYLAHRLVWLYVHGKFPKEMIDHINRNGSDNRILNLREATRVENYRNVGARARNKLGIKGVSRTGDKWRARINVEGKEIYLGAFIDVKDAEIAYKEASKIYFKEFAGV